MTEFSGPQRPHLGGGVPGLVPKGQALSSPTCKESGPWHSCSQLAPGPGKSHCLAKTGSRPRGSVASPE